MFSVYNCFLTLSDPITAWLCGIPVGFQYLDLFLKSAVNSFLDDYAFMYQFLKRGCYVSFFDIVAACYVLYRRSEGRIHNPILTVEIIRIAEDHFIITLKFLIACRQLNAFVRHRSQSIADCFTNPVNNHLFLLFVFEISGNR